ncbi:13594_t:CDS:1 [Dentiscutata heterogama]|uniref:13594_t:CDS:1 n=1 Tax=Dentiscutata heterogama TaxID=1316150 RepID=A0ACA9MNM1_9GLOM|nr:13594_t:CDS:1 [Dentiscutata heterogama]
MGKESKPHPIINKYNVDGGKTICSICKKEYDSPLNISTAKNHFRKNHLNIWNELKSDRKGGKTKSRHKVYDYFSVIDSGEYQCNLCPQKYNEPHCNELKYHFSRYHKEIWNFIKGKKKERGDRIIQENYNEGIAESSQTDFMKNDEIPDHDTINISNSSNNDDNDVEMAENMKKVSLIESIDMENENTEVKIKRDEINIKGKAKVNFK